MIEINGKHLCENCFEVNEATLMGCPHCGYKAGMGMNDPTLLAPGSILLGKYIVGKVMGKGGFGVTYLAFDVKSDRKVAIKEFFPYGVALRAAGTTTVTVTNSENADAFKNGAEKFYTEAKLVSKFNGNPNIVGVYEFFYENDTVYFVMEYLKGHTLKEHIEKNGPLNAPQALFVAQSVSNALMASHSSNVLHRDISPDNIIICDNGDVKLIDFGAARQVVAEHSQSFSVILKPGFAPLEQYQKKGKQGPWTDIYSLGATIYYSLTRDIPEDPMSRFDNDEEYSSNMHNIDPELWRVISTATELKIEDRYGDVFQLRNDLAKISFEPAPIVTRSEAEAEQMPEFRTAMPYGTSQQSVPPTGYFQAMPAQPTAAAQVAVPAEKKPRSKKPLAIAGSAAAVAVAAGIIIPISVNNAKNSGRSTPVYNSQPAYSSTYDDGNNTPSPAVSLPSTDVSWPDISLPSTGTSFPSTGTTTKVTNQKYTFPNGKTMTYTGDWKDGKPEGQGKGVYDDGGVYIGGWKNGLRYGQGTMDGNSTIYEGEWNDGATGKFKITYKASGDIYEGDAVEGKREGRGKYTFKDGTYYDGEWKDDKNNGQGTRVFSSGDKYVGEWKDNKKDGYGKYTFKDGRTYEGEYKNDERTNGKFTDSNGNIYEGKWSGGNLTSGTITKQLSNGKYVYECKNFIDDKMNGASTITIYFDSGNKEVIKGNATNNIISTGTSDFTWPSGATAHYEGGFASNYNYEGKGTRKEISANKNYLIDEGEFKNNSLYNGTRTWYNANGKVTQKKTFKNGKEA